MKEGYVYLVGAGPGDPGLITKRGMDLLKDCDVVIYDRLASEELLSYIREDCEKINVGKSVGCHGISQDKINELLVEEGRKGKKIVRLKGGDSFVFGRGGEEAEMLLEAGIGFEFVPGVTSCISVPELAGIPVTHRGVSRSFHVVTGHMAGSERELTDDYEQLAKLQGTLVFLMGIKNIERIMQELMQYGKQKDTPAAVIANGGTKEQQTVRGTVETIAGIVRKEGIKAPAVILVGEVAGYSFKWREEKLLSGKRIGLTGTKQFVKKLKDYLDINGASCYHLCYTRVHELESEELTYAMHHLADYGWIVFTSGNAVNLFMKKLREERVDIRSFFGIRFAVIGSGTEEALRKYGLYADEIPTQYTTRELGRLLCKKAGKKRLLLPRAKNGSKELTDILAQHGKEFDDIPLYEIINDEQIKNEQLDKVKQLDYIAFGSSDGVRGFFDKLDLTTYQALQHTKYVCIGEVTRETLLQYSKQKNIMADTYTAEGVAQAIINHVKGERINEQNEIVRGI